MSELLEVGSQLDEIRLFRRALLAVISPTF